MGLASDKKYEVFEKFQLFFPFEIQILLFHSDANGIDVRYLYVYVDRKESTGDLAILMKI